MYSVLLLFMLPHSLRHEIRDKTYQFWQRELTKEWVADIARGKEIGHRLADLVEEKTTAVLISEYLVKYQRDRKGEKRSRSMGDIWIGNNEIYHPVNVKMGIKGHEGQPNLVSLKKILDSLLRAYVDSYYFLIVKIDLEQRISSVYCVDMLDYLDFVAFDSGPGQMMLRSKKFFTYMERANQMEQSNHPNLTINEKIQRLMAMYKDGERRLIDNRRKSLEIYDRLLEEFNRQGGQQRITPATQQGLNLR